MAPTSPQLLDARSVGAYLRHRGVLDTAPRAVRSLSGGVSNVVLLVEAGAQRVVVKQALPRLRVAQEWNAKRERALTEAAALGIVRTMTPDAVPRVLDVDESACVLVIEAAGPGWRTWKEDLLDGTIDTATATRLGRLLGTWHSHPAGAQVPHDAEAFAQLRLQPFHRTVAGRHPGLAPAILDAEDELASSRECLVHGDYSPKNVLRSPSGSKLWVIDFEVAHRGAPVFDVAFLLTHLLLKAVHRPAAGGLLEQAADRFIAAYRSTGALGVDRPARLVLHVACLLLARVDGLSPAAYLTNAESDRVRALAHAVLREPAMSLAAVWEHAVRPRRAAAGVRP